MAGSCTATIAFSQLFVPLVAFLFFDGSSARGRLAFVFPKPKGEMALRMIVIIGLVLDTSTTAQLPYLDQKKFLEIYMEDCFVYEHTIACEIQVSLDPFLNLFVVLFNFFRAIFSQQTADALA